MSCVMKIANDMWAFGHQMRPAFLSATIARACEPIPSRRSSEGLVTWRWYLARRLLARVESRTTQAPVHLASLDRSERRLTTLYQCNARM